MFISGPYDMYKFKFTTSSSKFFINYYYNLVNKLFFNSQFLFVVFKIKTQPMEIKKSICFDFDSQNIYSA